MEHLIVHLLYEASIEGPVQYRWMYPFERFLRELKKKVENKAHVEASIIEAYIIEVIDLFTSQYFESDMQSKRTMPHRNDERTSSDHGIQVSIFYYPGGASGAPNKRWLSGPERHIIKTNIFKIGPDQPVRPETGQASGPIDTYKISSKRTGANWSKLVKTRFDR
ncbi:UNVERIFIED_CONTAM: hypothetical protein Sradi_4385800 [Sesamum radiatum]|uniref:DUF4218 domain-containing protein n=1 Tax=Sesamum radiatum TaxID=300843 RepID=A0AAW2NPX0_SESRA